MLVPKQGHLCFVHIVYYMTKQPRYEFSRDVSNLRFLQVENAIV